jgi:hypothetical protein
MRTLLAAFVLLLTSTVSAQVIQIANLQDALTLKNDIGDKYLHLDSSVKGTPFIQKELQNATIQGNKLKARYNANQDYMELDRDGKTVFFLPAIEYRFEVIFTDLNISYKAFEHEKLKYKFFKILARKDKAFLLSKEFVKFKPESKPKTNFEVYKPAKFERKKDTYFIKFKDKDMVVELPTKKSKFLKVFGNKASNIKSFLKKERINIKKEKDLIKVFNYFNTL